MSKVAIQGNASGSGTLTIAAPNTSTDRTLTLPDEAGTIITSGSPTVLPKGVPAFSAYQTTAQTLSSGTLTKITFDTEEYDTASCYDHTTNYRFTPNVAGHYLFSGMTQGNASYTGGVFGFYKNGSVYRWGAYNNNSAGVSQPSISCIIYLNGSTDYVEFYASFYTGQATAAVSNAGTSAFTWFQGMLLRAD